MDNFKWEIQFNSFEIPQSRKEEIRQSNVIPLVRCSFEKHEDENRMMDFLNNWMKNIGEE